jgi:hypothetical protein
VSRANHRGGATEGGVTHDCHDEQTVDHQCVAELCRRGRSVLGGVGFSCSRARPIRDGDNTGYFVVRVYVERTDTTVTPAAFGYNLCSAVL